MLITRFDIKYIRRVPKKPIIGMMKCSFIKTIEIKPMNPKLLIK